jgi:hypothetical protein
MHEKDIETLTKFFIGMLIVGMSLQFIGFVLSFIKGV